MFCNADPNQASETVNQPDHVTGNANNEPYGPFDNRPEYRDSENDVEDRSHNIKCKIYDFADYQYQT